MKAALLIYAPRLLRRSEASGYRIRSIVIVAAAITTLIPSPARVKSRV